ncbi:MAG: RNA ligase (ATP) [Nitrososphaerota archaeon]|nr:RNA ligase (ATP) [Nitrososphaerota archaeon]
MQSIEGKQEERSRKLVTVQTVNDIKPIAGADRVEVATVLGWHVVVGKGEFQTGSKCAYFEVDSFLPTTPEFEFLAKHGTKKMIHDHKEIVGYRLRTVRLRGQISQGLALPLSKLGLHDNTEVGSDITSVLGVVKYEAPIPASLEGDVKGEFPSFIPKSDEPRIQSHPDKLKEYAETRFYVTEKVDGSSVTVFLQDGELNVCSRNWNLQEGKLNTYWQAANALDMKAKLQALGGTISLQGELAGEGISGNKLKIKGHKILFYTAYDTARSEYLSCSDFVSACKKIGVETVPIISTNFALPQTVDELVAFATRKSVIAPDVMAEGVVVRSLEETRDPDIGRLSFKVLNPEYLLKYEE